MSAFGSGPSNGQFWYGSQTNFPGFLYKKNVGVGGRRSTKMNPGGGITCNSATDLYNKYKPGGGGVGASSTANRRAKNRLATICGSSNKCFPCYNTLGQYSNYTHNPNGFVPCPGTININGSTTTPSGTYTLTYANPNGIGTPPAPTTTYLAGTPVPILGQGGFSRPGFLAFTGWNTLANGTGQTIQAGSTLTLTSNTTLYAQFAGSPPPPSGTYNLTYFGNTNTGGVVPVGPTTYNPGDPVTILGNSGTLVKQGTPPSILTNSQFGGWNTAADGSGTNYVGGDTFNITQNTILYAQWLPPISGVQLVYNFGTSGSGTAPSSSGTFYPSYSAQPVVDNTGPFTRSGYTFAGWNTRANGTGTSYPVGSNVTMVPNTSLLPITLYAQWIPNGSGPFTLTYAAGTGGSGSAPVVPTPYPAGSPANIAANTGSPPFSNGSQVFNGWNTVEGGTGTSYPPGSKITMTANTTLYAQWVPNTNPLVTYDGNGETGGSVPAAPTYYANGVQVPILGEGSLTKTGYTFLGWNSSSTGAGSLYAPGYTFTSKTVTLFAQWAPGTTIKSCAPTTTYATLLSSWYDIPYAQVIADTTSATQTITIFLAAYLGLYGGSSGGEPFGSGIGTGAGPYGIKSFVSKTVITSTSIINNTYTTYATDSANNNYSQTITNGTGVTYWPSGATISSITFPSINAGSPYLYSSPATFNIESSRVSNGCGIGAYPTPFQTAGTVTQFYFFNQGVTLNYSNGTNTQFVNGPVSALYRNSSSVLTSIPPSIYPYVGVPQTNATSNALTAITIIPSSPPTSYVSPPMPSTTVQYDPNGATGPSFNYTSIPAPQYFGTYTGGTPTSITISGVGSLVKSGFTFSGWNTQANGLGTPYAAGATYNGSSGNLILYARWV
jgi:uncharacterized repeat protein (TIGR02543 family)